MFSSSSLKTLVQQGSKGLEKAKKPKPDRNSLET
jgi:hypothetical protein